MAGLRERKKLQTADVLHRAAMRLFFERGFDAVTAEEIAEQAQVSPRTFFRYFPVKAAVVFPRHAARLEAFARHLDRGVAPVDAEATTPFARVRDALLEIARDYQSRAEIEWRTWDLVQSSDTLTAYELRQDREWIAAIQSALREPVAGCPGLEPFEARVMANALIGAVRATLGAWFEAKGKADLERMGEVSFALLETGLLARGPRGAKP